MRVPVPFAEERRNRNEIDGPQCLICRRPLKRGETVTMIEMSTGCEVIVDEPENQPDSQGWFEVGPECHKKITAAIRAAKKEVTP